MSFARDYCMYYEGSYAKTTEGQVVVILGTRTDRDIADPYRSIVFVCHEIDERGNPTQELSVPFDNIILDLPEIGYIKFGNGAPIYLRYKPVRTVRKGFHFNRIVGVPSRYHRRRIAYAVLTGQTFKGQVSKHACIYRKGLYYKGKKVGEISDGTITMAEGAGYLIHIFQKFVEGGK